MCLSLACHQGVNNAARHCIYNTSTHKTIILRIIGKFLSSTPWTVVRFIKLKSPTMRGRYPPNWGTLQQPIKTAHQQAGVLSGASSGSCWRITPNFFFSPSLLISMLIEYFWLNVNVCIASVALPLSPPLVILVRERNCSWLLEETLWRLLFIGKGHSHICICRSLWETERMREKHEGYSKLFK